MDPTTIFFGPLGKKRRRKNHETSKIVLVLLSTSVKRVGVSRMRDFFSTVLVWSSGRENTLKNLQNCIGPTISIGRESWCLPYAGFLMYKIQTAQGCNADLPVVRWNKILFYALHCIILKCIFLNCTKLLPLLYLKSHL